MIERLREFGWWAHDLTAAHPWTSWVIHGLLALPFVPLVLWRPWTAPGAAFAYRELEQMWFRFLHGERMLWFDHIMDVASPGLVGWWFLHDYTWVAR